MVGTLQPLSQLFKIVDDAGLPTEYFIRWAQQRQIDIGDSITLAQASDLVTQAITDWSASRHINTTTPILGGGTLAADLTLAHATSGVTAGSYTNADITVDADGHVTAAANGSGGGGGSGGFPSNAWTTCTFGSTSTVHGKTVYASNETITSPAAGDLIEVRAIIPRTRDTTSGVFLSDLTNGIAFEMQSDNNNVFYTYSGSSGGAINASGSSGGNDFTGWSESYLRMHVHAAADYSVLGVAENARYTQQTLTQVTSWTLGTLSVLVEGTSNISKCLVQVRRLSSSDTLTA